MLRSLFNKVEGLKVCTFFKTDPNTVVSCKYCKISKNNFLTQHLRWLLLTVLPLKVKSVGVFVLLFRGLSHTKTISYLFDLIGHVLSISEYVLEKH